MIFFMHVFCKSQPGQSEICHLVRLSVMYSYLYPCSMELHTMEYKSLFFKGECLFFYKQNNFQNCTQTASCCMLVWVNRNELAIGCKGSRRSSSNLGVFISSILTYLHCPKVLQQALSYSNIVSLLK